MVSCSTCRHFQPDTINAPAGMGRCMHQARHGYWHPDAKHRCEDFTEAFDGRNGNGYQPRPSDKSLPPPGAE